MKYKLIDVRIWSISPWAEQGHFTDDSLIKNPDWEELEKSKDYVSSFIVTDEEGVWHWKIVHNLHPDEAEYVQWETQDPRFGLDVIDLNARVKKADEILKKFSQN